MTEREAPATEAGRRLFTDNEPMDMWESDGVTWEDVIAIEAEAHEDGMLRQLERQLADEAAGHEPVILGTQASVPAHDHDPDRCDECIAMVEEALRE